MSYLRTPLEPLAELPLREDLQPDRKRTVKATRPTKQEALFSVEELPVDTPAPPAISADSLVEELYRVAQEYPLEGYPAKYYKLLLRAKTGAPAELVEEVYKALQDRAANL